MFLYIVCSTCVIVVLIGGCSSMDMHGLGCTKVLVGACQEGHLSSFGETKYCDLIGHPFPALKTPLLAMPD